MEQHIIFYKEKRFKESKIGTLPEDWEVTRIDDKRVSDLVKSGSTPSKKRADFWNGKIPFVTIGDMTRVDKYIYDTANKISENALRESNVTIIPENSVLLSMYGTIGKVIINKVPVAISQNIAGIVPGKSVYGEFLYYALQQYSFQFKYAKIITLKHLDIKMVKNTLVPLPPLSEQKAIASVLSVVDEAIQKTDEIIAKTERLKKGLMQELLTKGIGHKEFKETEIGKTPKEWKVVRLGDILEMCQYGLSIKMSDRGKYPIVRMDEIENGYVIPKIAKRVDLDEKTFRAYKLEKGDILFNRTNSYELVGRTGIFLLDGDYVFASYLIRLRVKRNLVDPRFLTFYLVFSHDKLRQLATKAVHQANINATNLKRFKVPLPSLDEQTRIAEILSTVDKKLEIERKKRKKLVRIKRALMDLLLTGRIRVKVKVGDGGRA